MNLELSRISKTFKKKVLDELSMTASSGDCIAVLGVNGSGKSTLLSILAGITRCDAGSFMLDGQELFSSPRLCEIAGYVPQNNCLMEELTALDNLRLWYSRNKLESSLEDGLLSILDIKDFLKKTVSQLSGGMKKRLAIACALAQDPPLLLLDEPVAALDLACKEQIFNYYRYHVEKGGIIITATHDVAEVSVCSRCFILKNGKLVPYTYDGDVKALAESL